ncbi:hypothetical protein AB832_05565 [Flavobacteriaceae bacterium (ex Bugula neritina AB1)]|nr:hypothetical protein AB832_05565 [Flavobacteriaceae bacterium (ex Bugula neritina AB1)]
MKVAVVIGHHLRSKGAYSKHLKVSEWDFYNKVVDLMRTCPDVYRHNTLIPGYTSRIKNTALQLNKQNYDLVISLHFNAAGDARANGCETLYYFSSKRGKDYAKAFSDKVHEWTNIKVRNGGLKALTNKKDRGFAMVYYPKAPTILIEPFFGTNYQDCARIEDAEKMALILDDYINDLG